MMRSGAVAGKDDSATTSLGRAPDSLSLDARRESSVQLNPEALAKDAS
eukprot:SAG31_NODE_610_length_13564_cov_3.189528_1_plen_47_part_10